MPGQPSERENVTKQFLEKHQDVDPGELTELLASDRRVLWRETLIAAVALIAGLLLATAAGVHVANVAVEVAPSVAKDVVMERVETVGDEWRAHSDKFRALASEGVELIGTIIQTRLALDDAGRDAHLIRSRFGSLRRDLTELDVLALLDSGVPRTIELVEAATRVLARLQMIIKDLDVFSTLRPAIAGDLHEMGDDAVPDRTAIAMRDAIARLAQGTKLSRPWMDYTSHVEVAWNELAKWVADTRASIEDPEPLTDEMLERLPQAVWEAML